MQLIIMRDWYTGGRVSTLDIDAGAYGDDMARLRLWGEEVHHWEGADRSGQPLRVSWVSTPRYGTATLYAYEITGGA